MWEALIFHLGATLLFGCSPGRAPPGVGADDRASEDRPAPIGDPFVAPRCAENAAPQVVDRTAAFGLPTRDADPSAFTPPPALGAGYVIADDAEGDGDLDLFISGPNQVRLYVQQAGAFEGRVIGVDGPPGAVPHIAFVDVDADGWNDLLVFNQVLLRVFPGGPAPTFDPAGTRTTIVDDSPDADGDGFPDAIGAIQTLIAGDLDADGDLDLVLPGNPRTYGGEPAPTRVYRQADGALTLWDTLTDDGAPLYVQAGLASDRDDDGDLDILLVNDALGRSTFWRNDTAPDGPLTLVEDSRSAGIGLSMAGMGGDSVDLNGDGAVDYCFSDLGPPRCFLSDGRGAWYDAQVGLEVAAPAGQFGTVGWSVDLIDLDLDGQLELAQASSQFGDGTDAPDVLIYPDILWSWDAAGGFRDVTEAWGFGDLVPDVASTVADLDADGIPEIILASAWTAPRVLAAPCRRGAGLEVSVPGPPENASGVGARVEVAVGDRVQVRELHALRSHGQGPARLSFGLGDATRVDRVRVRWPDGAVVERVGLAVDQRITVPHPDARVRAR